MKIRLLVCGSRDWTDRKRIRDEIVAIGVENIDVLIEGEAPGADVISKEVILDLGFPANRILKFPANWTKFHKAAGPIRNQQMLIEGRPTLVLAFHDDLEKSKGTKDMHDRAKKAGINVKVFGKENHRHIL